MLYLWNNFPVLGVNGVVAIAFLTSMLSDFLEGFKRPSRENYLTSCSRYGFKL